MTTAIKKILITLPVLVAVPVLLAPRSAAAPKTTFRSDPRLAVPLPGPLGTPLDFEKLEKALEAEGVEIMVPAVVSGATILMPADKRTAKEAFASIEAFSLGHWEKVGQAWVLVMDRHLLELAELETAQKEQLARELLTALLSTLDERRQRLLVQGGALSQVTLPLAQQKQLADLGALGYWRSPHQISPTAARGTGVAVRVVNGQATILLPSRAGQPFPWSSLPAPLGGSR